jgi:hypothetical protein
MKKVDLIEHKYIFLDFTHMAIRVTKDAVKSRITISYVFFQELCVYILTNSSIEDTAITPPGLSLLVVALIAVVTSFKRCESTMVITVCLVEGNFILLVPLPPPVIICLSFPCPLESYSVASRFIFLIAAKTLSRDSRILRLFFPSYWFPFLCFFFFIFCNFKRKSRFVSGHG